MNFLQIFSVYDRKAHAYITPFFLPNDSISVRVFGDMCRDPEHAFGRHPEDYVLFGFGSFDVRKGIVSAEGSPRLVCTGLDTLNLDSGSNGGKSLEVVTDETS